MSGSSVRYKCSIFNTCLLNKENETLETSIHKTSLMTLQMPLSYEFPKKARLERFSSTEKGVDKMCRRNVSRKNMQE